MKHFLTAFVLLFLLAACSSQTSPGAKIDPQIINGTQALRSHPWVAQIRHPISPESDNHSCGGTLIQRSWILTAAHCTLDANGNPLSMAGFTIVLGQYERGAGDGTEQYSSVKRIVRHGSYNFLTDDNDIALLELNTPAVFSRNVRTVTLNSPGSIGENLTVIGWGIRETGTTSPVLRQARIPSVSRETCQSSYSKTVTSNMLCAGVPQGDIGPCYTDSGGPISNGNREQVGLVSWGVRGCNSPNFYSVYTNVSNYTNWIANVIPTSTVAFSIKSVDSSRLLGATLTITGKGQTRYATNLSPTVGLLPGTYYVEGTGQDKASNTYTASTSVVVKADVLETYSVNVNMRKVDESR